ncbi:MAG: glycosyltransferase [Candidatus Eisenbacteria bacterium]
MRISVLLTAYNAAWCVERALDSVFAQGRAPDEVLVADDGSTDDTVARIERRYGDRVRLLRLPHRGLTPSRRASFDAARGDWLAPLDADDWWEPHKLERQEQFLTAHPSLRWCGTDGVYVAAEGVIRLSWFSDYFRPVRELHGDLLPHLIERCFPLVSSMLIERGAYQESGGYDLGIPYSQDYDLWLKLAAAHPGGMLAEPLIHYWSSPGQLSRRYEARNRDDFALMRRVAEGGYRRDPRIEARGAVRAAAVAFELGLHGLRTGRVAEARHWLELARVRGPWRRRLLAWGGSLTPSAALGGLMRSNLLKRAVTGSRAGSPPITIDDDPPAASAPRARGAVS